MSFFRILMFLRITRLSTNRKTEAMKIRTNNIYSTVIPCDRRASLHIYDIPQKAIAASESRYTPSMTPLPYFRVNVITNLNFVTKITKFRKKKYETK